ncbi:DODA-type extradiol aromatic ring-opening family dioxygenase [Shewanella xiamenensis]|uniref:DODA-type extradiol aromatic ring-opening family dioxygenase n=1 Tax=Shewanella xiamenensis TaxID=332186 RepID=UPI001666824F|nr:class III extradiol ring-cleavage dioxygenase [Shewanella xiamenensis]MCL1069737.1 dioxygenase [Shewanella xiamenensis]MCR4533544.1 dioxygenase [Shewanella xiamenensis]MDI5841014.1 dioxygenase [Shewanella xiamenensis]MDI5844648.1 dioxygenase [Shewanella xiamenensis]MDI5852691.1 dioxygenase [Shewanella xiamenensis]
MTYANSAQMPVLFVPHGGGPLPLLNDANHRELRSYLSKVAETIPTPKAIVLVTAHWEEAQVTLSSHSHPGMLFDYYGFPPEAYTLSYPAPGEPQLAETIASLLKASGIEVRLDNQRAFDHGTFVPLKLMYPEANIPVVQMSLVQHLDSSAHIAIGEALASLRTQGVLIVGSGMSFHNMRAFFSGDPKVLPRSQAFDTWLTDVVTSGDNHAKAQLIDWQSAPEARFSHPREEHLIPLHVCFGAAHLQTPKATHQFSGVLFNTAISAYLWS